MAYQIKELDIKTCEFKSPEPLQNWMPGVTV